MNLCDGRSRVVIEAVSPQVEGGRYPIKRTVGDSVCVEADIFADGHDPVAAVLLHRKEGRELWEETPLEPLGNDRWRGSFTPGEIGAYRYSIEGWIDRGKTEREFPTRYGQELRLTVDPELARFGAWYELFPRSCGSDGRRHGTFRDVQSELPRIARMGFDILYLPPIHPIGEKFRKGRNNSVTAEAGDPGSPWAIGAAEGGHKAVHPQLGTLEEFRLLVEAARAHRIEIALDIAFQCSADHPYLRERTEWFRKRPDGTIKYAENPPKKYQDIYPFDFESPAWASLWEELKSVVEFWVDQGVKVFRVDNPHTKSFAFWAWALEEWKRRHPELVFLSEAFTRPKVMYHLAKIGFTQSYTYFTWRNTAAELREYLTELTQGPVREFFRPNFWPNTPDILPQSLQFGGRPAFVARLVLAATLTASYGIYGPAFELGVDEPAAAGAEEYRDSEKYQLKSWNLGQAGSLEPLIARLNRLRRDNPALQRDDFLFFHPTDNEQLLAYSKRTEDRANLILTVVSLDPHRTQAGWIDLSLEELGLDARRSYQVHEQLSDTRGYWQGSRNPIELDPAESPAAIFSIRRALRTERDFDYFM
jgi:starch synthase (maltosyl-transferring)